MNKRSFTITNNIINKSSGNFLKLAQGINDAVAQDEASRIKDAATTRFNKWREDRNFRSAMPVVGNLFNVLDPVQKMALLDYYIKEIESGKNKGDNVNAAFKGSDLLGATSSTNNFQVQRATALRILKGEFTKQNQSFQSGATPPAQTAEDTQTGAGGTAAPGAPGAPGAAAAAAAAGAGAGAVEKANFGFGQQDKLSPPATSPGFMTSPEGKPDSAGNTPASPAAPAAAAAAVSTAPATAANALPAATPPAPTGSKPPPPKYFFPGGKTGGIEGFHGPYISPEGKNRYFKTKYDAASRAYLFTGEFEDK